MKVFNQYRYPACAGGAGVSLLWCFLPGILLLSCREEYNPPAITTDYNYLVVEGTITPDTDSCFFQLSRTQAPGGNTAQNPEASARITILDENNSILSQSTDNGNGRYALPNEQINLFRNLIVRIVTSDGRQYLSDPIYTYQSPPVSSLDWELQPGRDGLQFFVSTGDPTGNSRYYRWQYEEVWEYRAYFNSYLEYFNGTIRTRPPENQLTSCWNYRPSTAIILGNSRAFSEDIIDRQPVFSVPSGTNRFNVRYSVEIKQQVLDEKGYNYWLNLQKMTEQGGSIFDAQPTELTGNIHSVDSPMEPVIGYISAGTIETKRVFVMHTEVPGSFILRYPFNCDELHAVGNTPGELAAYFGSGALIPVSTGMAGGYEGATRQCADCTFFGGSLRRPSFW